MKTAAVAGLAFVVVSTAFAGVAYEFTTTRESMYVTEKVNGRVWAEGDSYRAEVVTPTGTSVVVISRDGDRNAKLLYPKKSTWSNRTRASTPRSSGLFAWPAADPKVTGTPSIKYESGETTTIAGHQAVVHEIDATFDVESTDWTKLVLRGHYVVKARIWTTTELPGLPMDSTPHTGFYAIDREIDRLARNIHGMVLRHDLEVTRAFEDGPPQTDRTSTIVRDLTVADIAPDLFEVPESYAYDGDRARVRE